MSIKSDEKCMSRSKNYNNIMKEKFKLTDRQLFFIRLLRICIKIQVKSFKMTQKVLCETF